MEGNKKLTEAVHQYNLVITLENGRPCEDRVIGNAQRFEAGFYAKPNLRNVEQSLRSETAQQPGLDAVQLLLQLQANPELAAVLKGQLNTNLFG